MREVPEQLIPVKAIIINDLNSITIANIVKGQVDKSAELIMDDSTTYSKLERHVKAHKPAVVKSELIPALLCRVYFAISNANRFSVGMLHKLKKEYLKDYLNVYDCKFNRR